MIASQRRDIIRHAHEGIEIARDLLRDVAKHLTDVDGQAETYIATLSQLDRLAALQTLLCASEVQVAVKEEQAVRAIGLPSDKELLEWLDDSPSDYIDADGYS